MMAAPGLGASVGWSYCVGTLRLDRGLFGLLPRTGDVLAEKARGAPGGLSMILDVPTVNVRLLSTGVVPGVLGRMLRWIGMLLVCDVSGTRTDSLGTSFS